MVMTENENRYQQAFCLAFDIGTENITSLKFQDIPAWDSVGHMGLVAQLEDTFDITLEPDDIVDLSSYEKGIEILSKYNIVIR